MLEFISIPSNCSIRRDLDVLKSWLLFLISPCMVSVYYAVLPCLYHWLWYQCLILKTALQSLSLIIRQEDLRRITGVEFPEVVPVDSTWHYDASILSETTIKFVPVKPLNAEILPKVLTRLARMILAAGAKDSLGYLYYIYPERSQSTDLTGTHIRTSRNEW